jgi:DNA-binding transcriptional LysR family regulator
MDRLRLMETFIRVVETGSFSKVARDQGVQQSAISKQIAALEVHLKTSLILRSTRSLSLTEAGESYYQRIRPLLSDLDEAESEVIGADKRLRGQLRIAASVGFGRRYILPQIKAFKELYPEIQIDLKLNDHFIDLIEGGVDLAIRVGQLEDSSLIAKPLTVGQRVLVASKTYLEAKGWPQTYSDIKPSDCVVYMGRPDPLVWHLPTNDTKISTYDLHLNGAMTTNSSEIVRDFVMSDMGFAFNPNFLFSEDIEKGLVLRLWPDASWPLVPVYMVCAPNRRHVRRVKAFMNHLLANIPTSL